MPKKHAKKPTNPILEFKKLVEVPEQLLNKISDLLQDQEKEFFTWQALEKFLFSEFGVDRNTSEASQARRFMNSKIKGLMELGIIGNKKKAKNNATTINGQLYIEKPDYFKQTVEAVSQRLTTVSLHDPATSASESETENLFLYFIKMSFFF